MSFAGPGSVSKFDYASYLAAALSYLMLNQSDSVSLSLFAERIIKKIPPSSRHNHLSNILTALQENKSQGQTNLADVLHTVADTSNRRGLIILISDLIDDEQETLKGLAHLKYLNHDIIIFHVLDHFELTLDYDGLVQFEDMETGETMRTFPSSLRQRYSERLMEFIESIKRNSGRNNIDYHLLDTSEPLDRALMAYLGKRKRLM
jgi:uncharacterized protein (DUF58 family)